MLGPGLYVHIPFCARKCFYCDFTVYATRRPHHIEAYSDYLLAEARLQAARPAVKNTEFHTLFFGGGTPSLLPPDQIQTLVAGLQKLFNFRPGAEITLETNPEDLVPEKLAVWLDAGINRLSIGVQAFQDDLLTQLGRNHGVAQALAGYEAAREAGFTNVNLDLMFGLPGQTLAHWDATLNQVLALTPLPDHLSAYGLQVEPETLFWRRQQEGRLVLPGEETELAMLRQAQKRLTAAGYDHYEISNYARRGRVSQHNLAVWRFHDYLGLGVGAWSFWHGERWGNEKALNRYRRVVQAGRLPVAWRDEPRTERLAMGEMVMLGTRLREGLNLAAFRQRFGQDLTTAFGPALEHCLEQGWLHVADGHLRLTEAGLPLANEVWLAFLD